VALALSGYHRGGWPCSWPRRITRTRCASLDSSTVRLRCWFGTCPLPEGGVALALSGYHRGGWPCSWPRRITRTRCASLDSSTVRLRSVSGRFAVGVGSVSGPGAGGQGGLVWFGARPLAEVRGGPCRVRLPSRWANGALEESSGGRPKSSSSGCEGACARHRASTTRMCAISSLQIDSSAAAASYASGDGGGVATSSDSSGGGVVSDALEAPVVAAGRGVVSDARSRHLWRRRSAASCRWRQRHLWWQRSAVSCPTRSRHLWWWGSARVWWVDLALGPAV
jgi:hypothetical protein